MEPVVLDPTDTSALLSTGAVYLTGEEFIRLTAFNGAAGVTLTLAGRFLPAPRLGDVCPPHPRPFAHALIPATDRSSSTRIASLGDGWLLSASVFASGGTPRRGQCYVVVDLMRGDATAATPLVTLVQGYVSVQERRTWPGTLLEPMAALPGALRSITGTDPGAGVEVSETVPTNARWRLLAIMATLVTDGTVQNRDAALTLDDGATVFARFPAGQAQAATLTTRYVWTPGGARFTIVGDRTIVIPIPDVSLADGFRLKTVTTLLAAGDNWGAPQLFVEELIED